MNGIKAEIIRDLNKASAAFTFKLKYNQFYLFEIIDTLEYMIL